ncbi:hypothetical protein IAU60_003487 [Kwoniella sp. DSM 27419]
MPSLLSLFGSKKKAKSSTGGSSSVPARAPVKFDDGEAGGGSTKAKHENGGSNGSLSGRIATLRRRSSLGKPYDVPSRHAGPSAPKLDLPFTYMDGRKVGEESLTIRGVGEKVALQDEEREILGRMRLNEEDVKLCWEMVGKALTHTGASQPGLMLPCRPETNMTVQLYILALCALAIDSRRLSSFPTISDQFSQPPTDQTAVWRERLVAAAEDNVHPYDLAEVLKYTIRRFADPSLRPLIDPARYQEFVNEERAQSYSVDAYKRILVPRMAATSSAYLHEIFEVCSALVTHADENGMSANKLAYLLGWWVLCAQVDKDGWEELYKGWLAAGRTMLHLFYAWIRSQSTLSQLPTRLLELVKDYPSSAISSPVTGSEASTSNTLRRTLCVTLSCEGPLGKAFQSPDQLLEAAVRSDIEKHTAVPLYQSLIDRTRGKPSSLLHENSLRSLCHFDDSYAQQATPPFTEAEAGPNHPKVEEEPLYRPFLTTPTKQRSPGSPTWKQKPGDSSVSPRASDTSPGASFGTATTPVAQMRKHSSMSLLSEDSGSLWDNFKASGFGDSPNTASELGVGLSPTKKSSPAPASGSRRPSQQKKELSTLDGTDRETKRFRTAPPCTVLSEEIIAIDDTFISFVEDAQLDSPVVANWPRFALVRLGQPVKNQEEEREDPIEWLLITAVVKAKPDVTPIVSPPSTPFEPMESPPIVRPGSSMSTRTNSGSSRGFKDLAGSIKRSTSFQPSQGLRKGFFGMSSFNLSRHSTAASGELPTLAEQAKAAETVERPTPVSPMKSAHSEPSEMGEILATAPTSTLATTEGSQRESKQEVISNNEPASAPTSSIVAGPSSNTSASDWRYSGEGAAHIVFSYRGTSPEYLGQVLRINKLQFSAEASRRVTAEDPQKVWREALLPQLLPAVSLLQSSEVVLDTSWSKSLLAGADTLRPKNRITDGPATDAMQSQVHGLLMEDTTSNGITEGSITLALEIKPKWGFLPSPKRIVPGEAANIKSKICRFCLHTHFRGETSAVPYCPLDLYSGDEDRVKKAIQALGAGWEGSNGKANNWRVFMDGNRIEPNQIGQLPLLKGETEPVTRVVQLVASVLLASPTLPKLKELQATLDATDISDLATRFATAHPNSPMLDPSVIPVPTTDELIAFVELYRADPNAGKAEDSWTMRQRFIAYALSAIFKDCSVFVKMTLKRVNGDEDHWEVARGSERVKVVDLDLKPIHNLGKWYERDEEIWRYWAKTHRPSLDDNDATASTEKGKLDQEVHRTPGGSTTSGLHGVSTGRTSDAAERSVLNQSYGDPVEMVHDTGDQPQKAAERTSSPSPSVDPFVPITGDQTLEAVTAHHGDVEELADNRVASPTTDGEFYTPTGTLTPQISIEGHARTSIRDGDWTEPTADPAGAAASSASYPFQLGQPVAITSADPVESSGQLQSSSLSAPSPTEDRDERSNGPSPSESRDVLTPLPVVSHGTVIPGTSDPAPIMPLLGEAIPHTPHELTTIAEV